MTIRVRIVFFTLLLYSLFSCEKGKEPEIVPDYQCITIPSQNSYSRYEVVQSFDASILQGIASIDIPQPNGAMGRNKSGYFHVRFQTGIVSQADYAIFSENTSYLENAIKAIEYSFAYQLPVGSFDLHIPSDLSDQVPTEADLASGVSFFLSSLGLALHDFEQSTWYHSPSITAYKNRIEVLRPRIDAAAHWLLTQKEILEEADKNAPNRLLFNALAFYSLGEWLGNEELKSVGVTFATSAIAKRHATGYFIEGGGWDSSYQGVGINVGFNLYSLLPESDPLKTTLWNCLSCAANWQKSRVLETGEISLQGNTRVYPGGEAFLGTEKQIDWIDTMIGFFMMGYLSKDAQYIATANQIKNFYN